MEGKDLFASRRFWGILIAALGPVLTRYFGIAPEGFEGLTDAVVMTVGGLITVYGYVKRTQPITSVAGVVMRDAPKLVVLVLPLLLVIACSTVPQNMEQSLAISYSSLAAVRDTAGTLLNSGRITVDQAKQVQAKADDVRCALDLARNQMGKGALPTCDAVKLVKYLTDVKSPPATALGWLELSNRVLLDLQAELTKSGGKS